MAVNTEQLARELVRAIRGSRSQTALSRRLKYRTNMVYLWEAGRASPTAARFLHAAERTGVDVRGQLKDFFRIEPTWMQHCSPDSPEGVAHLLDDLRGSSSVQDLATATGFSRYSVARWLKGETEPRLPDFLHLVDKSSQRLLDFVACFADPSTLPSVKRSWQQLEAARRLAYDAPWSHAVLRVLELQAYRALPAHEPGWIARRLGISLNEERRCMELLRESGQVRLRKGKWEQREMTAVDTRSDPRSARQLKGWWAQVGVDRILAGNTKGTAFNLFGVSEKDLARLRSLQTAYYRELRNIVAESGPVERVVLCNLQLLALDGDGSVGAET